ncbi:MAG: Flp family type IVb pilin [Rhodospirillales bacterium]|nr:Flp family type IVb pilin [Rhodospirillales bacterium]
MFNKDHFERLKREETGASAIEYGLIAALVFLVIVAAVNLLSGKTSNMFNNVSNAVIENT